MYRGRLSDPLLRPESSWVSYFLAANETRFAVVNLKLSSFMSTHLYLYPTGSYSWPPMRGLQPAIAQLQKEFRAKCEFVCMYIEEAHAGKFRMRFEFSLKSISKFQKSSLGLLCLPLMQYLNASLIVTWLRFLMFHVLKWNSLVIFFLCFPYLLDKSESTRAFQWSLIFLSCINLPSILLVFHAHMHYLFLSFKEDEWPIRLSRYNEGRGPVLFNQPKTLDERIQLAAAFARDFNLHMKVSSKKEQEE